MPLKFKTIVSKSGKPRPLIFYNDEWMSFAKLAGTAQAISKGLSPQILNWRWHNNQRSEAGLFATKSKRGKQIDNGFAQEGGLFNTCKRELAIACMNGTNNDLLAINSDRDPYITPGEKRRNELFEKII